MPSYPSFIGMAANAGLDPSRIAAYIVMIRPQREAA